MLKTIKAGKNTSYNTAMLLIYQHSLKKLQD
jgi:hypothetical protein